MSEQASLSTTSVPADEEAPMVNAEQVASDWNDPKRRGALANATLLGIEARYGRFFQGLENWTPERLENLERQMALNDIALLEAGTPASYPPTPDEMRVAREAVQKIEAENEVRLRELLGDSDYAKYDAVVKAEPYRQSVGDIANAMRAKGVEISPDLEDSILNAYAAATRIAAREAAPTEPKLISDRERVELNAKQMAAFRQRLLEQMSPVLGDDRLRIFMETEMEQSGG